MIEENNRKYLENQFRFLKLGLPKLIYAGLANFFAIGVILALGWSIIETINASHCTGFCFPAYDSLIVVGLPIISVLGFLSSLFFYLAFRKKAILIPMWIFGVVAALYIILFLLFLWLWSILPPNH